MKNLKFKSRFLVLFIGLLTMCVTQVWAEDVTFSLGTTSGKDISSSSGTTKSNITVSFANGSGTALSWQTDHVRFYHNGSTVTISSTSTNITKVVINAKSGYTSADLKVGTTSLTSNDAKTEYTYTPASATNTVAITNEGSAQARLTSIVVTLSSACTAPATALSITSAATATVGTPLSLASAGGNGGTVTWSVTNGTGSATVDGSTLNPATAGTVTVKAHQDQNGTTCEQDAEQTVTISKQATTITLSEAGSESNVSGTHYVGDSYDLPTTTEATCGDKVLVGWSTVQIPTAGAKPVSNYYEKGASVTLGASNKFYAVFATASAGGVPKYSNVDHSASKDDFSGEGASGGGTAFNKTVDGITYNATSGYGNTSYVQLYQGCELTISSSNVIKSIVITTSAKNNNNYSASKITLKSEQAGSYSAGASGTNYGTWTANSTDTKSVTFSMSAQARMTGIVVTTYEQTGSSSTYTDV